MGRSLEGRAAEIIKLDGEGNVADVKWEELAALKENCLSSSQYRIVEDIFDTVIDFLKEKVFLTRPDTKGSFAIRGYIGVNAGPHYSVAGIFYNFTRKEDAEKYIPFAGKLLEEASNPFRIEHVV
jgi:hypothetical protein